MEINTIYNENCLDTMSRMPDGFVDLVVTSPPYDNLRDYEDGVGENWSFDVFMAIAQELTRVIKPGGVIVWVVGDASINGSETGTSFRQALYFMELGMNLHDTMIYAAKKPPLTHMRYQQEFEYMFVFSKGKPATFNGITERKQYQDARKNKSFQRKRNGSHSKGYSNDSQLRLKYNIWAYRTGGGFSDKIAFKHPATFPEELARDHIYSWSNPGDLVYDPFGGSGTTPKMAHILNRNWIMSEMVTKYCEIATKRLDPVLRQIRIEI